MYMQSSLLAFGTFIGQKVWIHFKLETGLSMSVDIPSLIPTDDLCHKYQECSSEGFSYVYGKVGRVRFRVRKGESCKAGKHLSESVFLSP